MMYLKKSTITQIDDDTIDVTESFCEERDYMHPTGSGTFTLETLRVPVNITDHPTPKHYVIARDLCIPTNIEYRDFVGRDWRKRMNHKFPKCLISNTKPKSAIKWEFRHAGIDQVFYRLNYKTTQTLNKHKTIVS